MAPPFDEQPLVKTDTTSSNDNFELESQFILRLPSLPAASLRAAIKSGVLNLKDRLSIQIDQDLRNGCVRFDGWILPAKIMDLPTILESLKTLDNKNFYKTADISQIMICKEECDDPSTNQPTNDPDEIVKKTKDGKDKRHLYPHGITKPLKNVRKRRFRKTLRKKYGDFPEIEKEVKRLLRQDCEAKHVRYEIVDIEDDAPNASAAATKSDAKNGDGHNDIDLNDDKLLQQTSSSTMMATAANSALDDRDLFGDVVSSSSDDDDDDLVNNGDGHNDQAIDCLKDINENSEDNSRLSSAFRDYLDEDSADGLTTNDNNKDLTFSQAFEMDQQQQQQRPPSSQMINPFEHQQSLPLINEDAENESIRIKVQELEQQIFNLQQQRHLQQTELDSIENIALKQRFQAIIDDLMAQELQKKQELDELKLKF